MLLFCRPDFVGNRLFLRTSEAAHYGPARTGVSIRGTHTNPSAILIRLPNPMDSRELAMDTSPLFGFLFEDCCALAMLFLFTYVSRGDFFRTVLTSLAYPPLWINVFFFFLLDH